MTADKCKVLLIGSGGVGTIASYSLEYEDKAVVTSVLRSDYAIVKEKGFTIDSIDYGHIECYRPTNIVNSVESAKEYGPFDYIVVVTKSLPDITNMVDVIAPAVTSETAIVLIQNGIHIEEAYMERFPKNTVLSGVSMIGSSNKNGCINHETTDFLRVGVFPNENVPKDKQDSICQKFVQIYNTGKNECVFDENVKFSRWRKLIYNATLNPVCALTQLDVGRLEIFGAVDSIIRGAMKEVIAIAASDGVQLPESVIEFMIRSDDPVYYKPSMLIDYEKGNYMEVEVILGNPIKIAQKNSVDAPILTLIYHFLSVLQCKIKEEKGALIVPKERPVAAK